MYTRMLRLNPSGPGSYFPFISWHRIHRWIQSVSSGSLAPDFLSSWVLLFSPQTPPHFLSVLAEAEATQHSPGPHSLPPTLTCSVRKRRWCLLHSALLPLVSLFHQTPKDFGFLRFMFVGLLVPWACQSIPLIYSDVAVSCIFTKPCCPFHTRPCLS